MSYPDIQYLSDLFKLIKDHNFPEIKIGDIHIINNPQPIQGTLEVSSPQLSKEEYEDILYHSAI